jgi:hypothetical protein
VPHAKTSPKEDVMGDVLLPELGSEAGVDGEIASAGEVRGYASVMRRAASSAAATVAVAAALRRMRG